MGKRDRAKKDVSRLQLRREVIRQLGDDNLAQVHGGLGYVCLPISCGCTRTGQNTTISTGG